MVRCWVERYMEFARASLGPDTYEIDRDADDMLDELINDMLLPTFLTPSKDIMSEIVKIVIESRKALIKAMEENVDDQRFREFRYRYRQYVMIQ